MAKKKKQKTETVRTLLNEIGLSDPSIMIDSAVEFQNETVHARLMASVVEKTGRLVIRMDLTDFVVWMKKKEVERP